MTKQTARAGALHWRTEDLAELTAKALALAAREHAVVGVIVNERLAPRDGRKAA